MRKLLTFLLLTLNVVFVFAIKKDSAKIILKNNDTLNCQIEIAKRDSIITGYNLHGNDKLKIWIEEKVSFIPIKQIKEIQIGSSIYHILKDSKKEYDDAIEEIVTYEFYYIARLIISGKYSLYECYDFETYSLDTYSPKGLFHAGPIIQTSEVKTTQIVKNDTNDVFINPGKKRLMKAFKRCETLVKNVKENNYRKDITTAVNDANSYCE